MKYFVYIVRCVDNTLYTGIATNVDRRITEHNSKGTLGAKYTKARQPVILVYTKKYIGRSKASKEEARIKKLSRKEKEKLIYIQ